MATSAPAPQGDSDKRLAKTSETSSQVFFKKGNPFAALATINPQDRSPEEVVEACIMIGQSFMEFFKTYGKWTIYLKNKLFKVSPGSKGIQLDITNPQSKITTKMYWHEFFDTYFLVTKRRFQQLEKETKLGTWEEPDPVEPIKVNDEVTFEQQGHTHKGVVQKIHETARKVDVKKMSHNPEQNGKILTLPIDNVKKVVEPPVKVKKINAGDLILCTDVDGGTEYEYVGNGKFTRTKTLSLNKQAQLHADERQKEADHIAKEKKKKADADEKQKQAALAKAALDAIADNEKMLADQKKMVKAGQIPAGLVGKKLGKKADSAPIPIAKSWTVRREPGTADREDKFEVLDRSGESIMKGTQKACIARRAELTAKYAAKGAAA